MQAESRKSNRLTCSIPATAAGKRAVIGEITNISLDGIFVSKPKVDLPIGATIPVSFSDATQPRAVSALAEVVRITEEGLGLRFLRMSAADSRRLRRRIVQLLSVQGTRDNAIKLLDTNARKVQPIRDGQTIQKILRSATSDLQLIGTIGQNQATLKMEKVDTYLHLSAPTACTFQPGEEVIVVYVHGNVSYSFKSTVASVQGPSAVLALPTEMAYSERRSASREQVDSAATLQIDLPWEPGKSARFKVLDIGHGGLSFLAPPKSMMFLPGSKLPACVLQRNGKERSIEQSMVRHVTPFKDEENVEWLRVGLSVDTERQQAAFRQESIAAGSEDVVGKIRSLGSNIKNRLAYLYHSKMPSPADAKTHAVIDFTNSAGQRIAALLDTTFPIGKGRTRAPLLIVVPGFGGRKETMSPLANIVTDNWRRNLRDMAVLRFDGTNNLGESDKDPGCESEGRHNLRFTITGAVRDLLAALEWAKNNKIVDPTNISIFSLSIGSIAARRVLTMPEAALVTNWISFMGASDVANTGMRAAGNIDFIGNYERGIKTGIVSLNGCLGDADHFSEDACGSRVASLDDARRDMTKIAASVTWYVGKYDAFVDPKRVHDIMSAKAPGRRVVVELNAGHIPRHGDEAVAEFSLISKSLWRHLYGTEVNTVVPSKGWLAAREQTEWKRVRHGIQSSAKQWWKNYLVGDNDVGFDAWSYTKEYRQLVADQTRLALDAGDVVSALDAGAGTGNMTVALANADVPQVTAVDLVPEALERIKAKLPSRDVETLAASIDGGPIVALRRWLTGDFPDFNAFVERMPPTFAKHLRTLSQQYTPDLHAALRGASIDVPSALRKAGLSSSLSPNVKALSDCSRSLRGIAGANPAHLDALTAPGLSQGKGLPFPDESFDVVVCSLVLSYLSQPEDTLFEFRRVLRRGKRLVLSSMLPGMDSSRAFLDAVAAIENADDTQLPPGATKEQLLAALRAFSDSSAKLLQLEEDGSFKFFSPDELSHLLSVAGFENITTHISCGDPGMAVIATASKVD